jgi:hypothetical protein
VRRALVAVLAYAVVAPGAAWSGAGWYLLRPPLAAEQDGRYLPNERAPLRTWDQVAAFDTADACQTGLSQTVARSLKEVETAARPLPATADALQRTAQNRTLGTHIANVLTLRCIASDDPRLK